MAECNVTKFIMFDFIVYFYGKNYKWSKHSTGADVIKLRSFPGEISIQFLNTYFVKTIKQFLFKLFARKTLKSIEWAINLKQHFDMKTF